MRPFPYDFYHLWTSAYVARLGGNPYAPDQVTPVMLQAGWPAAEGVSGFMHPFWSLAILTPLSYLPFTLAAFIWELSILAFVIISAWLFFKEPIREIFGKPPTPPTAFLATALFPPLLSTVAFGQTSALLLVGCAGWLSFFCKGRFFISGIILSLTALKPQLFIPLYVWVFINQSRNRDWMCLLGFMVGLLLQACIAVISAPHTASLWWVAMSSLGRSTSELHTPTLARIIGSAFGFSHGGSIAIIRGALIAGVLALKCRGHIAEQAVLFFLPLGFITTTYTWSHSFLPLLLPYLTLLPFLEQRSERTLPVLSISLALWGILELSYVYTLAPYSVLLPIFMLLCGLAKMTAPSRKISS